MAIEEFFKKLSFLKLDYWLFELVHRKGSFSIGDSFFPWVTDLHHTLAFKILIGPLLLFFYLFKHKKAGLVYFMFLLAAAGASDFSGSIVKNHFVRLRPFENHEVNAIKKSPAASKSFYSNHASNTFTLATYTSHFVPVLKAPLWAMALLVAYSRVYNGVHYPSDVIAGGLAGVFWGFLFAALSKGLVQIAKQKK